jgi:translocation and assembly module TamB
MSQGSNNPLSGGQFEMSRRKKRFTRITASAALLIVLLVVIGIEVIRSAWFAGYVSRKIVSVTEESTGGRVELGSFVFDWRHLHARVTGFVLRGKEPQSSPPLLSIDAIDLTLKLLPSFKKTVDLQYLGLEKPTANIIVFSDGTTNIPQPKVPSKSNDSALQTIVDLAVRKFDLNNGSVTFADQQVPFTAHGRDLRANLSFSSTQSIYRGDVGFNSVQFAQPGRPPVEAVVHVPIMIAKDRVEVDNASIRTAASSLVLTGSLVNPQHPVVDAHLIAHVSLAEVRRATGTAPGACADALPCFADADIEAQFDEQKFAISKAAVTMGRSALSASGGRDSIRVAGKLAMDEIGAIFQFPGDAVGEVDLAGIVKSVADRIVVQDLKIAALGANLTVDGSLAGYKTLQLHAAVQGVQLGILERRFLFVNQGYDGILGGAIDATGDLSLPGISGVQARARLDIVPVNQGVPLKGRIDAEYSGAADQVKIARASFSLPHSLLTFNGVLGRHMDADFTTTDTSDLYPAMAIAMKQPPHEIPLKLIGGKLELKARADGPLTAPSITAQLTADRFAVEKRTFDHLNAAVTASKKGVNIANGSLTKGTMQASFSGSAGLRNWALTNDQPIRASAQLSNAELPDLLALAGESTIPATGKLRASLEASGTVGNPLGTISASASDGSLYSEPFQTLEIQAAMSDQLVRLTRADWIAPAGTVQASGTYTHPRDTLLSGDLRLHASSNQVRLNAVSNLSKQRAGMDGTLQFDLDAAGNIHQQQQGQAEIVVASIRGDVRADNIRDQNKSYGNLSAHADTSGSTVAFRADSNLSGAVIHAAGQTTLAKAYPTTADVSVQNLALENLPFDPGVPVKGMVALTAHAQGTLHEPVVTGQLNLVNGAIDGETIDKLQASARYTAQLIEISSLQLTTPAGSATLNASFAHPVDQFTSGTAQVHLTSNAIRVDRIHTLQQTLPGLGGTLKIATDAAGELKTVNGQRQITASRLDATAGITALTYNGRQAGNANLTAKTNGGAISVALDSDLAHSAIHAQGEIKLTPDFPVTAQFSARDLRFSNLKPFLSLESISPDFEALAEIEGSVSGSARSLDRIRADVRIPRLEASMRQRGKATPTLALHNEGPIELQLDRSVLTARSAHLVGARGTDITLTGTIGFAENNPLNLIVKANADLGLLQDADRDFYSSGAVTLDASIRGSFSAPLTNGSLQLKNATVNMVDVSNGIANANGTILLSGSTATIRNLTGESGGGKITISGSASYASGDIRYSLRANANRVRTRQQGVSIVNNADLTVSGNLQRGLISGTVTIVSLGINPQSDLGSILTTTSADQAAGQQVSQFLSNMRLNIHIRTSPDVRFESALAHDIQGEADLNLVGSLSNPGMTGRVTVTEGNLIFFGNEYTVNRGVIAFYNPLRIRPQLNVSLETNVQSVDVVLTVTGPIDNLKLSYRSDPPIQFDEIVGLLAMGKRPSSDPTIVGNQAPPPQQSVGQMGETAIVSQAIASPVSSRLERVFGVTQLKLDPTFASGSALPQASLTLQQRVANNVTFTYTQDYSQANSELVRVEWAISPKFSAVATRDINGIFGVDFFYKRQFR